MFPSRFKWKRGRIATFVAGALALACTMPAAATLGQAESSVAVDRAQIRANVTKEAKASFTVHTLTIGREVVREYVAPGGTVFAVTWSGPSMPDLHQLLGEKYFTTYTTSPHRQRGGRGHLIVNDGGLVVESNGRMRAFHGRAYLTNALPAGVTTDAIE